MSNYPGPPPPPPPGQGGWGPPPAGQPLPPMMAQANGKATTSMVLGIVGLVVCPLVCSILAIIFGNQAKGEIQRSNGMQTGEGQAKAGIITGGIGLALYGLLVFVYLIILLA